MRYPLSVVTGVVPSVFIVGALHCSVAVLRAGLTTGGGTTGGKGCETGAELLHPTRVARSMNDRSLIKVFIGKPLIAATLLKVSLTILNVVHILQCKNVTDKDADRDRKKNVSDNVNHKLTRMLHEESVKTENETKGTKYL